MGDDIKLENYKKNVSRILDDWGTEAAAVGKELGPIEKELKDLTANNAPTPDQKKRIDELKQKCAKLHTRMEEARIELQQNLNIIDVPPKADDKEFAKIPAWIKDIIKRKGLALGKDVTIAPTVDFDLKAKKLKSLGIKITW